ncbi:MAG: hypothetical protein J6K18_02965 [Bacilli bacterium]|nr:hypothetical protein [Bacilli bacterium]
MEFQSKKILEQFKVKEQRSYNFLMRGVDIMKALLNRNFDSFIIGSSVRNLYLCKPIDTIEIITTATPKEIKEIFPALIVERNGFSFLKEYGRYVVFTNFSDEETLLGKKLSTKHYNKKLINALNNKFFTVNSLALTPNLVITNIFDGIKDLDSMLIKTTDKAKSIFTKHPIAILEALVLVAEHDFNIEPKCLKAISRYCSFLEDVKETEFIRKFRQILKGPFAKHALEIIVKYKLFRFIKVYDLVARKLNAHFNDYSFLEQVSILYLLLGSIPDASFISQSDLKAITETMTITQLITTDKITPMMVYNIGSEKLFSANRIALAYKIKYSNQERLIKKLSKESVISSSRDLQFSELEIIELMNGERSLRVKIVMNLLLEKVINGEVYNHHTILREEAKLIINDLSSIFDYKEPEILPVINDEYLDDLVIKYKKEYEFLVKVYLSDEKSLYDLSPLERDEIEFNAKTHAKEFLLETSQYRILEERGLI